jgi:hypothetical protein
MRKNLADVNSELLNTVIGFVGVLMIAIGLSTNKTDCEDVRAILISVGTSIVASSVVVYLSSHYLFKQSRIKEILDTWKLTGIYRTRAEMNMRTNVCLEECKKEIDIIAFGLKSLRESQSISLEGKIKNGLKLRILTIDPQSTFLPQREKDEGEVPGQIKNTIEQLTDWVKKMKGFSPNPNNIELKYYDTLPLDFYFRVDKNLFLGPYLYGRSSQQTISYEFESGGAGFEYWSTYFEKIWNDSNFTRNP